MRMLTSSYMTHPSIQSIMECAAAVVRTVVLLSRY